MITDLDRTIQPRGVQALSWFLVFLERHQRHRSHWENLADLREATKLRICSKSESIGPTAQRLIREAANQFSMAAGVGW